LSKENSVDLFEKIFEGITASKGVPIKSKREMAT